MTIAEGTLTVLPDLPSLAAAAADGFVATGRAAIAERGVFRAALSGGSTPTAVYPLLAAAPRRDALDWSRVELFWGDERAVPPDAPQSNFGVAQRMLLRHLPDLAPAKVHRMPADAPDLDLAARDYEAELRAAFGAPSDAPPCFDLVWLGMGPDGHTASLFPGSTALEVEDRWVAATWAPGPAAWRMTLTYPVLNAARLVTFLVAGEEKAAALQRIRAGEDLPAARVHAQRTEWLVDAAAAST